MLDEARAWRLREIPANSSGGQAIAGGTAFDSTGGQQGVPITGDFLTRHPASKSKPPVFWRKIRSSSCPTSLLISCWSASAVFF